MFSFFSRNGHILPSSDAVMPLSNIEYAYGFGVYESIRAVRGKAIFLSDHIERLEKSAAIIGLEHAFKPHDIQRWTDELLTKTDAEACNLKILLIGAREPNDATLFIIPLAPLFPDKKLYRNGASAITVRHERYLPHAKALSMLPSYMAYRKAKQAGGYDALFVNRHDCITEGTRTNFWCIRGTTLFCPPKEEILEGVTLMHVTDMAKANDYTIEYGPIRLEDVPTFDGAFLTSTSSKIMPLSTIDDVVLKVPEALQKLMKHFDEFLKASA